MSEHTGDATPEKNLVVADEAASAPNAVLIVATLCFGGLVASLMQTLVVPLQPELPALLGASRTDASWVITATLLAAAVAMP
ncbi:MAG TPA: MFS transporter, partial [Gordonia sp. (in: high G+C Gram-positive bacteria)]|nr:MFS transporter [Gordonia sp. (in: high G+C Gram-positive bacteria)]